MYFFRPPSASAIERFRQQQIPLPLTYSAQGATQTGPPAKYVVDHTRVRLGEGEPVYTRAKQALADWRQGRQKNGRT